MQYRDNSDLLKDCLKGERIAQKALYDTYKTQMYSLAYRITGDFMTAEDVLQEGFLKVFRSLGSFKGNSKLGSWIHTIIARTAIAKVKDKLLFTGLEELPEIADIGSEMPIDSEYLELAILALPEGYRTVFTLYEIEGFKHNEIAEMLEISVGTSKSQLFKAKKMLQSRINSFMK